MSISIKPLEDRIVIRQVEAEQTTASGLVIPDTAKEKPQEGEVIAVGPGRVDDNGNRVPVDVKVGDTVIYSRYGGSARARSTRSSPRATSWPSSSAEPSRSRLAGPSARPEGPREPAGPNPSPGSGPAVRSTGPARAAPLPGGPHDPEEVTVRGVSSSA